MTTSAVLGLMGLWSGFMRSEAGLSRPMRLTSDFERRLGDEVLEARDLSDLKEVIEEALLAYLAQDAEGQSSTERESSIDDLIARLKRLVQAVESADMIDVASLERVIGHAPAVKCHEGGEYLRTTILGIGRLALALAPIWAEKVKVAEATSAAPLRTPEAQRVPSGMGSLLASPDMPFELRRILAGFFRTLVCGIAIARAEERGLRLEGWLALHLANTFTEGLKSANDGWMALARQLTTGDLSNAKSSVERAAAYRLKLDELFERAAPAT